jgi:hypothetical protein
MIFIYCLQTFLQAFPTGFQKSDECSKTLFSQKITFLFSSNNITLTKKHNFEENFQSILKIKAFTFEKQTFQKACQYDRLLKSLFFKCKCFYFQNGLVIVFEMLIIWYYSCIQCSFKCHAHSKQVFQFFTKFVRICRLSKACSQSINKYH